jgi:hypothetical protein
MAFSRNCSYFVSDAGTTSRLRNVWALAARPAGAVLWSVGTDGRQTTRITGPSIGGAFARYCTGRSSLAAGSGCGRASSSAGTAP